MLFDSLRVRDLPTSKHPKEEREAHLTGRRHCLPVQQTVAAASGCPLIPTGEMGRDPVGVKRQHRQLGRRTAHEAVEEQEVFGLSWSERRIGALAGETAKRQARADLERCSRSRRERADGADFAGANEERSPPARLERRSDQAELKPAHPLQPAKAFEDTLERLDAIPEPCRLLVAEVLGQVQEA